MNVVSALRRKIGDGYIETVVGIAGIDLWGENKGRGSFMELSLYFYRSITWIYSLSELT